MYLFIHYTMNRHDECHENLQAPEGDNADGIHPLERRKGAAIG